MNINFDTNLSNLTIGQLEEMCFHSGEIQVYTVYEAMFGSIREFPDEQREFIFGEFIASSVTPDEMDILRLFFGDDACPAPEFAKDKTVAELQSSCRKIIKKLVYWYFQRNMNIVLFTETLKTKADYLRFFLDMMRSYGKTGIGQERSTKECPYKTFLPLVAKKKATLVDSPLPENQLLLEEIIRQRTKMPKAIFFEYGVGSTDCEWKRRDDFKTSHDYLLTPVYTKADLEESFASLGNRDIETLLACYLLGSSYDERRMKGFQLSGYLIEEVCQLSLDWLVLWMINDRRYVMQDDYEVNLKFRTLGDLIECESAEEVLEFVGHFFLVPDYDPEKRNNIDADIMLHDIQRTLRAYTGTGVSLACISEEPV